MKVIRLLTLSLFIPFCSVPVQETAAEEVASAGRGIASLGGIKAEEVQERYFIEFMAYNESMEEDGSPGHMFVEFWREQNGSFISYGKYGFYPSDDYTKADFKNAVQVEGALQEESDNIQIDVSFRKEVSQQAFTNAMQIKDNWVNSSTAYTGLARDCISFVLEVAEGAGLIANRSPFSFPADAVRGLEEDN